MHEAVLSRGDVSRIGIQKDISAYLRRSPVDDIGIECSRLSSIKESQNPEEISDILRLAKTTGNGLAS